MSLRLFLVCMLFISPSLSALPINVTAQQFITSPGQLFNFSFSGLPTVGTQGQFSITLNGDFSGVNSESSTANLDAALGILDLGNGSLLNGIITNTISGVSLNTYSRQIFESNDIEQSWVFDLTDSLLASLLADGTLGVVVKNDAGVNPLARINPDFVRVGYSYSTIDLIVREASGFWLFVLGFSALLLLRLRFKLVAARKGMVAASA